jgi:hypothetical protein
MIVKFFNKISVILILTRLRRRKRLRLKGKERTEFIIEEKNSLTWQSSK